MPAEVLGLVVADEHERVAPGEVDGVELGGGERPHALVVDGHLRGKVLGDDPPDGLAVELLDQVLRRELPDVADARQPLDQDRLVEGRRGHLVDLDGLHRAHPPPRRLSARRYAP